MKDLFEKIANKEIPSKIVWEDLNHIAFLDISQFSQGHTLVIPKKNIGDYIFDLKDEEYTNLMLASKKVARLLKEKLKAERIFVWVQGLEVPHVHVHLIPHYKNKPFSMTATNPSSQELEEIQKIITSN